MTAGPSAPSAQVVVTQGDIDQMVAVFAKTWQRPPSASEEQELVDDFIRSEIYYREALAIGLDRDDAILKRRLRQKMEFIYEDISAIDEPSEADLEAFLQLHRAKYQTDPQLSFRQVYFNPDRRSGHAEADARRALAQLAGGAAAETLGDPTQLPAELAEAPLWDIGGQFGDDFGKALLQLPTGRWVGPVRSGFGLHLVYLRQRIDGQVPALAAIRDTVRQDWTLARQQALKDAAYAKLRARYAVTVEPPKTLASTVKPGVTAQ